MRRRIINLNLRKNFPITQGIFQLDRKRPYRRYLNIYNLKKTSSVRNCIPNSMKSARIWTLSQKIFLKLYIFRFSVRTADQRQAGSSVFLIKNLLKSVLLKL